jgi:hypothetical protein
MPAPKTGGLYKINCHEHGRLCRGRSGFIGPGTGPLSVWNIGPSTTTIRELPVRPKLPNRLYKGLRPCAFAERIFDSTQSIIEDADGSSSRFAASLSALFSQTTSGGIEYTAYVVEGATGVKSGVVAVLFSANPTQVLGTGNGTTTSINQSTDQSGTVNKPDVQTNAIWHVITNWLYSPFASCLGQTYDLTVMVSGANITETCHL